MMMMNAQDRFCGLSRHLARRLLSFSLAVFPLLIGCQSQVEKSSESAFSETGALAERSTKQAASRDIESDVWSTAREGVASQKITFRTSKGTPEFSLQLKITGAKLLDSTDGVIANLILESDGAIRLTDASNVTVGYVERAGDHLSDGLRHRIEVKSPKRTKTLFSFVRDSNGNALLTSNNGSPIYRLEATDNGYLVRSDKADLYTVLANKGAGQIQTEDGQTIIATDSAIVPAAIASFGFTKLTRAQQAGLAYAIATEALQTSAL